MGLTFYSSVQASDDVVLLLRLIISNSSEFIAYDNIHPGDSVGTLTSKDKVIFYSTDIGVINPTQKKYEIEIICVDSDNKIIFRDSVKRPLTITEKMGADTIGRLAQNLELDPTPGAIVNGQLSALVNNKDYFVKLFFDKKLIGVTKFHYEIKK